MDVGYADAMENNGRNGRRSPAHSYQDRRRLKKFAMLAHTDNEAG